MNRGRIICDTSTFSVGDKVRVRSMIDSSKVWDQTVAAGGTALIFDVPCFDYYKICMVQNNTEIGGIYKTLDDGQTIYTNSLNKSTLGGIQGILDAHQESDLLSVADEVTITVDGNPWIMQIAGINLNDSHEVILASKNLWTTSSFGTGNNYTASVSTLRNTMSNFYNAMSVDDKQYVKKTPKTTRQVNQNTYYQFADYVYPPTRTEVDGVSPGGTPTITLHQYPLFSTTANRIRTYNDTATMWSLCDGGTSTGNIFSINESGTLQSASCGTGSVVGVLPCFRLTANV